MEESQERVEELTRILERIRVTEKEVLTLIEKEKRTKVVFLLVPTAN